MQRHDPTDKPRSTDSHKLRDIAVAGHLAGRNLLHRTEDLLDVALIHHQPLLPGVPLNGPATFEVIQPP